jgi:co-chaperonin GroES (HSP10)
MQYLEHFLIHTPKRVQDTKKIGDVEIYIETKFNEFEHRVPYGTVVSTPLKYPTSVKPGDKLYVHHHVVMDDGNSMGDGNYKVRFHPDGGFSTQCYAYVNEEGIHTMTDWVLVEPVKQPNELKSSILEIVQYEKQPNRYGRIYCDSPALEEIGIKKGDVVYFAKDADYEMDIEGKKLWRMSVNHLLAIIDGYQV